MANRSWKLDVIWGWIIKERRGDVPVGEKYQAEKGDTLLFAGSRVQLINKIFAAEKASTISAAENSNRVSCDITEDDIKGLEGLRREDRSGKQKLDSQTVTLFLELVDVLQKSRAELLVNGYYEADEEIKRIDKVLKKAGVK